MMPPAADLNSFSDFCIMKQVEHHAGLKSDSSASQEQYVSSKQEKKCGMSSGRKIGGMNELTCRLSEAKASLFFSFNLMPASFPPSFLPRCQHQCDKSKYLPTDNFTTNPPLGRRGSVWAGRPKMMLMEGRKGGRKRRNPHSEKVRRLCRGHHWLAGNDPGGNGSGGGWVEGGQKDAAHFMGDKTCPKLPFSQSDRSSFSFFFPLTPTSPPASVRSNNTTLLSLLLLPLPPPLPCLHHQTSAGRLAGDGPDGDAGRTPSPRLLLTGGITTPPPEALEYPHLLVCYVGARFERRRRKRRRRRRN